MAGLLNTEGLLLASLAYGPEYARLFLGPQLVSLLDPTNLPAVRDRASFILFTDEAARPTIEAHPRWQAVKELLPTSLYCLKTPDYGQRYDMQGVTLGLSMARAYRENRALMYLTADGCYGQGVVAALRIVVKDDQLFRPRHGREAHRLRERTVSPTHP